MGLYARCVFPHLMNVLMDRPMLAEQRRIVLAGVAGNVLEIGFGSGLNLPHYPPQVRSLITIDRNAGMAGLVRRRTAGSTLKPRFEVADGQHLPMADASFDAVVSTWTLCSIPDAAATLGEVRRVLKPTGRFHFIEHGLSPEPGVVRWQHWLNGYQRIVADGCHLNRDMRAIIGGQGFRFDALDTFYLQGLPRFVGYSYRGVATPF